MFFALKSLLLSSCHSILFYIDLLQCRLREFKLSLPIVTDPSNRKSSGLLEALPLSLYQSPHFPLSPFDEQLIYALTDLAMRKAQKAGKSQFQRPGKLSKKADLLSKQARSIAKWVCSIELLGCLVGIAGSVYGVLYSPAGELSEREKVAQSCENWAD